MKISNKKLMLTSEEIINRFNIAPGIFESALSKARKTFIRLRIPISENIKYRYSISESGIKKSVFLSPFACCFVTAYSITNNISDLEILQLFYKKQS